MTALVHSIGPLAVAAIASIAVHELGHILFGRIVRRKADWLAIGPLIIYRDGKILFRWKHKYFGGAVFLYGEAITNKEAYRKEKIKAAVSLLGGPVTSFLSGFGFLYAGQNNEYAFYFGIFSILIGTGTLLFTDGLPAILIFTNSLYAYYYFLSVELMTSKEEKQFDFLLKELRGELQKVKADSIEKISLTCLGALYFYSYCSQINFNMTSREGVKIHQYILNEIKHKGLGIFKNKQKRSVLTAIVYLEEMNLLMEGNAEAAETLYAKLADADDRRLYELKRDAVIKQDDKAKSLYISELQSDVFNRNTILLKIEEEFVQKAGEYMTDVRGERSCVTDGNAEM
ncbi:MULTISPECIES: site-2 protease family protein [Bacillus]|uniref:Peptidase M50 domain-containing protein n=1 Tax=Bacillus glycinifermentans TaxID=1664069 RepID=A0AAJ4D3E3_9BACI|nr:MULTISPECIES: site-2 protease family protein [Bacillus]KKB72444.1 hypothetical protein TH62_16535 [Bacillus sp. TH008]MDU0070093.1 site-2 protease family protein [Bacillus sp. IG6]MED8017766.1 site-2 protease family protein [Bacillus glycinifermentans]QAT66420.1 hypothetical protein EQZ20_16955 [Bacillus glycinifermentans]WKB76150.1 site-2 protease family protein [Bacillus glycinifermentans]